MKKILESLSEYINDINQMIKLFEKNIKKSTIPLLLYSNNLRIFFQIKKFFL